jgi:hypothetical protein
MRSLLNQRSLTILCLLGTTIAGACAEATVAPHANSQRFAAEVSSPIIFGAIRPVSSDSVLAILHRTGAAPRRGLSFDEVDYNSVYVSSSNVFADATYGSFTNLSTDVETPSRYGTITGNMTVVASFNNGAFASFFADVCSDDGITLCADAGQLTTSCGTGRYYQLRDTTTHEYNMPADSYVDSGVTVNRPAETHTDTTKSASNCGVAPPPDEGDEFYDDDDGGTGSFYLCDASDDIYYEWTGWDWDWSYGDSVYVCENRMY